MHICYISRNIRKGWFCTGTFCRRKSFVGGNYVGVGTIYTGIYSTASQ